MRRAMIACGVMAAVALAAPALAGEGVKCTHSTQDCLNYMASHYKDRGWVGVEYEPDTMEITRVMPDSPAETAGFQAGDVMLAINGVSLADGNEADMKKVKELMVPGSQVTYTIRRGGASKDLAVTLDPVPEQVLAQWIGMHMLEGHTEVKVASAK